MWFVVFRKALSLQQYIYDIVQFLQCLRSAFEPFDVFLESA